MAEKKQVEKTPGAEQASENTPLQIKGSEPVYVPKKNKGDDTLYVAVNGVKGYIKRGETVYVSPPFKEVIENMLQSERDAEAYIEANSNG